MKQKNFRKKKRAKDEKIAKMRHWKNAKRTGIRRVNGTRHPSQHCCQR